VKNLAALMVAAAVLAPAVAGAYDVAPVADGGSVAGKVLFKGASVSKKMLITKNNDVCGDGEREIVEVAARGGALENAIVVIDGIGKGKPWAPAGKKPLLNQKGCRFLPPVMVVPRGGDLDILNSDPVLHNIHSYEVVGAARRTLFNFGQPNQGQTLTKPVSVRRGEWVKIECDAHDFMHAWMFAAASPYAAVTKEDGSFAIADVPPGKYRIRALHPVLGVREGEVAVSAKGKAEITLSFEGK
jgi:hypothetical protein